MYYYLQLFKIFIIFKDFLLKITEFTLFISSKVKILLYGSNTYFILKKT